jgi:hypothetical protein
LSWARAFCGRSARSTYFPVIFKIPGMLVV